MNKFSFIELAILRMLDAAPLHGYAMSAKMEEYSAGKLSLPAGSLYPALHKLEKAGLIASEVKHAGGRKRRTYQLTANGSEVLAGEIASWRIIVRTMNSLLGVSA